MNATPQPEDFGAIGNLLRTPRETLRLIDFLPRFNARRITFRLPGMAEAALDPALGGRIRGALGTVLVRTASREAENGAPCPWMPPCAFEVLFRKQGRMTSGTDFPDSFVIDCSPVRDRLDVSITLFGIATEWAPAAAEAMAECLLHQVRWFPQEKRKTADISIIGRRMSPVELPVIVPGIAPALEFVTPLVASSDTLDPELAFLGALKGLGFRLEGIARWHGLSLAGEDWPARMAQISTLRPVWTTHEIVSWQRGSRRQNSWVRMRGHFGSLHVTGTDEAQAALAPLLSLAACTHLGADIVFGCGKFHLD